MFSLFQIEIWIHLFAGSVIFESACKVCHGIKVQFFSTELCEVSEGLGGQHFAHFKVKLLVLIRLLIRGPWKGHQLLGLWDIYGEL